MVLARKKANSARGVRKKKQRPEIRVQQNLVALSLQGAAQHKLLDVLTELGGDEEARSLIVEVLKDIQQKVHLSPNRSLREELTGRWRMPCSRMRAIARPERRHGFRVRLPLQDRARLHPLPRRTPRPRLRAADDKTVPASSEGSEAHNRWRRLRRRPCDPRRESDFEDGGVIHGFEPSDEQRALLTRNAKLNDVARNVRAVPLGLWDNDKTTLELVGDDAFAHAVPLRGKVKKGGSRSPPPPSPPTPQRTA